MNKKTAKQWLQKHGKEYTVRYKAINACAAALGVNRRTARKAMVILEKESVIRQNPPPTETAKILLLDIETAPMEVFTWKLHKNYLNSDNVIKDWSLLTWSAKWMCDSKIMSAKVNCKEAANREDKGILQAMWDLLNEADIVIAHNALYFDLKKLNTRFLINGLSPPMSYQVIDTLREARKFFAFSSNKLDYINSQLGLSRKIHTNFDLWKRCVTGDELALAEMENYNRQDITALEDIYFALRPWIKSHPNMGLYVESDVPICPNCGNSDLTWGGYYTTPSNKYRAFRCKCGAIGRSRYTSIKKEDRKRIVVSTAR